MVAIRFMLDTNVVDALLGSAALTGGLCDAVAAGEIELMVTHLQVDEIGETPNSRSERRDALRDALVRIPVEYMITYGCVIGRSRVGQSAIVDGAGEALLERLRDTKSKHSEDALITSTAHRHGATLVTNDKGALSRARSEGIAAITVAELEGIVNRFSAQRSKTGLSDGLGKHVI